MGSLKGWLILSFHSLVCLSVFLVPWNSYKRQRAKWMKWHSTWKLSYLDSTIMWILCYNDAFDCDVYFVELIDSNRQIKEHHDTILPHAISHTIWCKKAALKFTATMCGRKMANGAIHWIFYGKYICNNLSHIFLRSIHVEFPSGCLNGKIGLHRQFSVIQ